MKLQRRLEVNVRLIHAAAVAAIFTGVAAVGSAQKPAPASVSGPLLPNGGIYLGIWALPKGPQGAKGTPESSHKSFGEAETEELEATIGRKFALHIHYYAFDGPFPDAAMNEDAAEGRVPVISWEAGASLKDVIDGKTDDILIEHAKRVKAYGKPIFIRWMWEMNFMGPGHAKAFGSNDTAEAGKTFVGAWRHIWQVFHDQGVTNVVWLWNPNEAQRKGTPIDAAPFYPGDAYVDWIGIDAYDWKEPPAGFVGVFSPLYNEFASHGKPFMIVETGAFPGNQVKFLHDAQTLMRTQFPMVQGFCYFDAPGHTPQPWSISGEGLKAFKELANDPHFEGHP